MDLGDMLDKITGYDDVLKEYGYIHSGDGKAPWSIRYTNEKTGWFVDTRNSEWKLFAGKVTLTGNTVAGLTGELKEYHESVA